MTVDNVRRPCSCRESLWVCDDAYNTLDLHVLVVRAVPVISCRSIYCAMKASAVDRQMCCSLLSFLAYSMFTNRLLVHSLYIIVTGATVHPSMLCVPSLNSNLVILGILSYCLVVTYLLFDYIYNITEAIMFVLIISIVTFYDAYC